MTKKRNTKLNEMLESLDGDERRRLYKRATTLRRAASGRGNTKKGRRPKHVRDWFDEDDEHGGSLQKRPRRRPDSIEHWMENLLKEEQAGTWEPEPEDLGGREIAEGIVVRVVASGCGVLIDDDGDVGEPTEVECRLPPELAATQRTELAIGDRVSVALATEEDEAVVESVGQRRTMLSRPDPGGGKRPIERVIASNFDVAVVVAAVKTPPLRTRLIDRYLIAIERGGAQPLICVNKMDLVETEAARGEELEKLDPYRSLDIDVVGCSAETGDGIGDLRAALAGRSAVFIGHSGVGKSSLLNALDPSLDLETKAVRGGMGQGRHTTTASAMYELAGGIRIIDTPGIREFGLWKLGADELRWYFHEFEEAAESCRFSDCTHTHEPKCGVRTAVAEGTVAAARYDTYRRLIAGL